MKLLRRPLIVILATSTLLLAACQGNANQGSPKASASDGATSIIKVGVSGPLTGGNASWGLAMRGGAEIAADTLKKQGGVKVGGHTYNFEIVPYDDHFAPAGATSAVNRMISQDNIKYILGPTTGAAVSAVLPIIQSNKVLEMETGFGTTQVTPKADYSFRTILTPNEYCQSWYEWIKTDRPQIQNIVLIGPNDVVGKGSVGPCKDAVATAGLKSEELYYERSNQDYSAIVARILAYKPDAVDFTGGAPGEAAGLAKQLLQSGFKGLTMKSGGSAIQTILDVAGPVAAKGHLYFEQVSVTSPPVAEFYAEFQSRYKSKGELSVAIEYHDSLMLLAEAMKKAGSTDTTAVRDALHGTNFTLPLMGEISWGGQQTYGIAQQILSKGNVVEWEGDAGKTIGVIQAISK